MTPPRMLFGVRFEQRAQLLGGQHFRQATRIGGRLHTEGRVDFDLAVACQPAEVSRQRRLLAGDAATREATRGEKSDVRPNV